ncbi:hypothetical protein OHA61_11650 [Streptomyces sp. NBC_00885]|uniref:hypothetical protein n=1 Tax=Streptomyces sp. NBC_00885 TaxID=2975857 RepID=UPI00386A2F81|nr:hypothetical protein OHA61_11650 [Streptomyces sp. NBC_00885]
MNRKEIIGGTFAALMLAGGFGAYTAMASVPNTGGTIHACTPSSGAFRSVYIINYDAGARCTGSQTHLQWNPTHGAVAVVRVTATDTSPTIVGTEGPNNIYSYVPVAECPEGYVATGGGWKDSTVDLPIPSAAFDGPTADGLGWQGHVRSALGAGTLDIGVTVICEQGTTSP